MSNAPVVQGRLFLQPEHFPAIWSFLYQIGLPTQWIGDLQLIMNET
jgi:hypothetical protein